MNTDATAIKNTEPAAKSFIILMRISYYGCIRSQIFSTHVFSISKLNTANETIKIIEASTGVTFK